MKTMPLMCLRNTAKLLFCVLGIFSTGVFSAHGGVRLNDWNPHLGELHSDLDSDSPAFGDGTTNSGSSHAIWTELDKPLSLKEVGSKITFKGEIRLTGWSNYNPSTGNNQFRFGLFDSSGMDGVKGWLGFFGSNSQSNISSEGEGFLYRRVDTSGVFCSAVGAERVATSLSSSNSPFDSGEYSFEISYERTSRDEVLISWSIVEDSGAYSLMGSYLDSEFNTRIRFDRVGIFIGGNAMVDQVNFKDLEVTFDD